MLSLEITADQHVNCHECEPICLAKETEKWVPFPRLQSYRNLCYCCRKYETTSLRKLPEFLYFLSKLGFFLQIFVKVPNKKFY